MTKKQLSASIATISVILLILVLFPVLTGSTKLMIVLSGSMTPEMLPGDMIAVKKVDPATLKVGDIIAFQQPDGKPNTVFTHRIIDVYQNDKGLRFQTKGDANNVEDDFLVPAENVRGQLTFVIPYLGWLPELAKNKLVFIITIIIPVFILIIDEVRNMVIYSSIAKTKKHEKMLKKLKARTVNVVNYNLLAAFVVACGLIMTFLIVLNANVVGTTTLNGSMDIGNAGFMPLVYVITTNNPAQQFEVQPWYGVVEPAKTMQVKSPVNIPAEISTSPYILPVDWIIRLANLSPYLPPMVALFGYIILTSIITIPLWCRKKIKGLYAHKFKQSNIVSKLKKKIQI